MPPTLSRPRQGRDARVSFSHTLTLALGFILGCVVCTMVILNAKFAETQSQSPLGGAAVQKPNPRGSVAAVDQRASGDAGSPCGLSILDGTRILVAIASFDFSQFPHLEEVLDAYHDMCVAGANVDVVIHTTVPYPVTLIDLLNSRLTCTNPSPRAGFSITIVLKSKKLRLHLVDEHRPMFYDKIDEYDVFIYTEDDIRVTPKTVATYIHETERVKQLVGPERAADFNVGIVRYEYNFPPDIVIDDKTRHVTQNVTRVYWEHSWKPPIPKSVDAVPQKPLSDKYVHMTNHHQGMFIATRDLLKAWKEKKDCKFDVVRDRPGLKNNPAQPAEGTQRVWMSSQMLYGSQHCGVQQVIPIDKFGALTVLHLPNKNYRRVGKKGRLGGHGSKEDVQFSDGTEVIEGPSKQLLTAMELHIEMRRRWRAQPQLPYKGIQMVDDVRGGRFPLIDKRMLEFRAYESRGGVMSEEDMTKVDLVEDVL